MRTAIAVTVLLVAATSLAVPGATSESAAVSPESPPTFRGPPREVVAFWSQRYVSGICQSYSSEEKAATGYVCESADDFYCSRGDTIVRVDWWGQEQSLPGGDGVPEIDEFIIRFCEDDSTSRHHHPGHVVYEEHVVDFTSEYLGTGDRFYYTSEIPGGFVPTPGETYWLSIMAVNPFFILAQQWHWYECAEGYDWRAEGTMKSEFWACPEWTPWSEHLSGSNHVEHAFILYSSYDTPVEGSSWGQIKAMFR